MTDALIDCDCREYGEIWSKRGCPHTEVALRTLRDERDAADQEIDGWRNANDALTAALEWTSVNAELPVPGKRVQIHWANVLGNHRISIGCYATKYLMEEPDWDFHESLDVDGFDERNELFYRKPGWYEEPWCSDYYYPIDGEILNWREIHLPGIAQEALEPTKQQCPKCGAPHATYQELVTMGCSSCGAEPTGDDG